MVKSAGILGAAVIGLALSGCSANLRIDPGPDEFSVVPNAALAEPGPGALPPPGGASAAAPNPFAAAYAALGGNGGSAGPLRGAGAVRPRANNFWTRWFRPRRSGDILDPDIESARLRGLGVAVLGGR